ncbi:MAG: ATP synthase F1 subunit gamma [Planctomycetota bacterium]|jgi:F-type H+-transporting ATPase subunit gamma
MARIREIRKRIGAVRTIQRITKTMQMIATAKFTTAQHRAKATKPYSDKVRQLVAETLAVASDVSHPLIDPPAESPARERLLVITSNRGLCGAYNANVLRAAIQHVRQLKAGGRQLDLETAGKKAVGFFRFQRIPIAERHSFGDEPKYDEVERLAQRYIDDFAAGRYDAVRVASMQFVSNTRQVPQVSTILPLKPEAAGDETPAGARALYEFSPSTERILSDLLPLAVKSALFQAFLDAAVSEQVMRMVAMKAATENAKELSKTLNRQYNRARQTQITTELMEIIGGTVALE